MTDHLQYATADARARVRELGGDEFVGALASLVGDEEEFAVLWFDAKWDDAEADEILDWSVVEVAAFGETVVYVELSVDLSVRTDEDDEQGPMSIVTISAFGRVLLGPPLTADRFELEPEDLRSFIAADAARESVFDDEGTTRAQVAAYLAMSPQLTGGENAGPRPVVFVIPEGDKLVVSGLPGPEPVEPVTGPPSQERRSRPQGKGERS